MTMREADKIIKAGKPVKVCNKVYNETFVAVFVRRDRRTIHSVYHWNGEEREGVFMRDELEIVKE